MLRKFVIDWSSEFGWNSSVWSFWHDSKAFSPINVTWGGIVKLSMDAHLNALHSMIWSFELSGILTNRILTNHNLIGWGEAES
mgnify:CR=1 FL=1